MTAQHIQNDAVYKQVLADSFGGVVYDVADQNKYDAAHLIATWDAMTSSQKNASGGIMRDAINFLKGE